MSPLRAALRISLAESELIPPVPFLLMAYLVTYMTLTP